MLGRPFGMMRFNATLLRVANRNEASSKAVYYTAVTEQEEAECMCVCVCVCQGVGVTFHSINFYLNDVHRETACLLHFSEFRKFFFSRDLVIQEYSI